MNKTKKRFISISMSVLMAFTTAMSSAGVVFAEETEIDTSAVTTESVSNNSANPYGLAEKTKDGTILHAFCWSFNTIKANMKDIAEAGYASVQCSPANKCYIGGGKAEDKVGDELFGNGKWYYHYQPADWTLGNYQLGTEAEFAAMCAEADKYGVKIIVDVLPNHTTPFQEQLSGGLLDLKNKGVLYHDNGFNPISGSGWNDRYQCTTGQMDGLPDVNTEGADFQNLYMNYVNTVIGYGADGFRYDTAKHIGLPSDPSDTASHPNGNNFWPLVTGKQTYSGVASLNNTGNLFMYGEVLGNVKLGEYTSYLEAVCGSEYGNSIRSMIKNAEMPAGAVTDNKAGISSSKLVTWVESHDNYINDGQDWNAYDDQRVRWGWAALAAQKEGAPLFFNRPANSSRSSKWGDNKVGKAGNDNWKHPEVAAVNNFRNAMVGEDQKVTNPNGNKTLMIERGDKGAVILNMQGTSLSLNTSTSMADGDYTDQAHGGTFHVSGGRLTGTVNAGEIAVLYNASTSRISASPSSGTYKTDTVQVTLTAMNVSNAQYRVDNGSWTGFSDSTTITVGSASDGNGTVHTVDVKGTDASGNPITQTYTYTKKDMSQQFSSGKQIYCVKPSGWGDTIYCYAYVDETTNNAAWPGVAMTNEGDGIYSYDLPSGWTNAYVIFNDGNNQDPASQQPGFQYTSGKTMAYEDGAFEEVTVQPAGPSVTSSVADGTTFDTETKDIVLTLKNATSGTYSVDNGPVKTFTDTATVTLGQGKIADTDVTVKVTATDGSTTKNFTFTYHKKYNASNVSNASIVNAASAIATVANKGAATSPAVGGKYATNPNGSVGKQATITIDGSYNDWSEDMIIAQGLANDSAMKFKGSWENCVMDSYALYAAWDSSNLYLAWQNVNTADVTNGQGGALSDGGLRDLPMVLALDTGSGKNMTGYTTDGKGIWGIDMTFETDVDHILVMHSDGSGTPGVFTSNGTGLTDYEDYCGSFDALGIEFESASGCFPSKLMGIKNLPEYPDTTGVAMLYDDSVSTTDLKQGHNTEMDTFFEIKIPFSAIGMTASEFAERGVGVMQIVSRGESPMDGLPHDKCFLDNTYGDYASESSNSHEKDDNDTITVPLARVGNGETPPPPPPEKLNVNFGADRSSPQADTTDLTLKAIAYDGTAPYQYQFSIDGSVVQTYSSSDTYAWDTTGGDHTISVTVKDAEGNTVTSTKAYTIEGDTVEIPVTSVTVNPTSLNLIVGDNATLTATVAPSNATNKKITWTSSNTSVATVSNGTVTAKAAGTATITATSSNGEKGTATVTVTKSGSDLKISNFVTDCGTSAKVGTTVTLAASAEGGSGSYQYAFKVKSADGTWATIQDTSSKSIATWKTSVAGQKTLYVYVKDSTGKVVSDMLNFTVIDNVVTPLSITNFTTNKGTTATKGTTVTLSAKAAGGSGSYQYAFKVQSANGTWATIQDTSSKSTASWKASVAGQKTLYAYVKDSTGKVVSKALNFNVTEVKPLSITSFTTNKGTTATKGTTVTLSAAATGGSGSYQYAFKVQSANGTWATIQDTSSKNTAVWDANVAGQKTLYAYVKDSTGKVVSKTLSFNVTDSANDLAVTSFTASTGTSAASGTKVTLSVSAKGGTGFYQYAFKVKSADGTWFTIQDTSAQSKATWTTGSTGTKTLYAYVKDSKGKVAQKTLTFTVK